MFTYLLTYLLTENHVLAVPGRVEDVTKIGPGACLAIAQPVRRELLAASG